MTLHHDIAALLPDLRGYAYFLLKSRPEADDLVQECVVRALAAQAGFQPGTSLKAWLFTIQRNVFYEQARRRKREVVAMDHHARSLAGEADGPRQEGSAELNQLSEALWQLSPLLREALVLVGARGLSNEEAATICGVPVGTIKARVSRARNQLEQRFAPGSRDIR